jgi:hypothetical protein
MRDIYVIFSIIYFLAGGLHLYQQYKTNKLLEIIVRKIEKKDGE